MLRENDTVVSALHGTSPETKEARERRRALGIYYTPLEAAKVLARWVIRHPDEVLLEPSFGGCSMLTAAISVFRSLGNDTPSNQFYGFDIDAKAFKHLAEMGIDNGRKQFQKADFLRCNAGECRVSAVLANPPFVSYHRQSAKQRKLTEQLRQKYFPKLPRLASLWAFFVLHSMSFLKPGGRMAFVLPSAIGNTDYGRMLLQHLTTKFAKVELVQVSQRIFIQAGTDERIALLLLSDYAPEGIAVPVPADIRHIARIAEIEVAPGDDESGAIDPFKDAETSLKRLQEKSLVELGSIANVQIGEVVGNIPFFVKKKGVWRTLDINNKYLFPLLSRSAQVTGLSVTKAEIDRRGSAIPYLLVPPASRLPGSISLYLSTYAQDEIDENRTFEKRTTWYRCSYDTTADAFIGSMNHEYPRVIGNEAGISCSNSFYKILLTKEKEYARWLPMLSLTTPFRLSAEILGRVRGSGGFKLEPSDTRRLMIPLKLPAISSTEFAVLRMRIDELIRAGEINAAGELVDEIVYLKPGLIDALEIANLRKNRSALTFRRLAKHHPE